MYGYYDQDTNDPLNDVNFLTTSAGRRAALSLLKRQIAKNTPVNWAAQDALKNVRGVARRDSGVRR